MHKYAAPAALAVALNITAAAAQTAPTCETFLARLRNAGRELSLPSLPNPRVQGNQQRDVANSVDQVIYDWPSDGTQLGALSCANREFILYRMQADTSAYRQQHGDIPRSLQLISAAIFAYTGQAPARSAVLVLLARQPRQPNDIDVTLPLPGGHMVWLSYDNFAIN